MYIVLSSQIVNHFEVHYRDIDKLCGCLNVFLIIISYPAEVFQLESSVGIFQKMDNRTWFETDNCIWFS